MRNYCRVEMIVNGFITIEIPEETTKIATGEVNVARDEKEASENGGAQDPLLRDPFVASVRYSKEASKVKGREFWEGQPRLATGLACNRIIIFGSESETIEK